MAVTVLNPLRLVQIGGPQMAMSLSRAANRIQIGEHQREDEVDVAGILTYGKVVTFLERL